MPTLANSAARKIENTVRKRSVAMFEKTVSNTFELARVSESSGNQSKQVSRAMLQRALTNAGLERK